MKPGRLLITILCFGLTHSYASSAEGNRQPVIDMHLHGYSGQLQTPNPNTGKLTVRNGDEHRKASLMMMKDHNIVLGAVSANGDLESSSQILAAWRMDAGDSIRTGLFFGKKAG